MSKPKFTSEDDFYENLVLGLDRTLANLPRICDLRWEKRSPCEKAQILNWEQRHCVYLPNDMKKFYLSTDGFALYWSFNYGPTDVLRVSAINVPHLLQLILLRENSDATLAAVTVTTNAYVTKTQSATDSKSQEQMCSTSMSKSSLGLHILNAKDRWGHDVPRLTTKSKIFEINNISNVGKVCLVYESTGTNNPKIYLLELKTFQWQFLADTFTEYLRMSVAHLGLPYWELCFSDTKMPSWTEQLFLLLAPHLLHEHTKRRGSLIDPQPEYPHNVLDPNVFRVRPKPKTQLAVINLSSRRSTNDRKSK